MARPGVVLGALPARASDEAKDAASFSRGEIDDGDVIAD